LASSRGSSNGVDWRDVAGNIVAFEAINGVRVELRITTTNHHGRADLWIALLAHPADREIGEVAPLASVSLSTSATRLRSLEAAIIHGLYLLDGKLASNEFERIKNG